MFELETRDSLEKREKKQNPMMKFVYKNVFKPVDSFLEGILNSVEKVGLTNILLSFYQAQDYLWWPVANQLFDYQVYGQEHVPPARSLILG